MSQRKKRILSCLCALTLLLTSLPETAGAKWLMIGDHRSNVRLEGTVIGDLDVPLELEVTVVCKDEPQTPIVGASVTMKELIARAAEITLTTDAEGKVLFQNVYRDLTYSITVFHRNHEDEAVTYTYTVNPGEINPLVDTLTIQLEEGTEEPDDPNGGSGSGGGDSGDSGDSGSGGSGSGGGDSGDSGDSGSGDSGSGDSNNGGSSGDSGSDNNGDNGNGSGGSGDSSGNGGGSSGSGGSSGGGNIIVILPDELPGVDTGKPSGDTGKPSGGTGKPSGSGTTARPTRPSTVTPSETNPDPAAPTIDITVPEGEDTAEITRPVIEESAETGEDIRVLFPVDGKQDSLQIPAFTDHDVGLTGSGVFSVTWTEEGGYILTILVPHEETEETTVGVPHSLLAFAAEYGLETRIVYEDELERNFSVTADELSAVTPDNGDLIFAYERREPCAYMGIEVQNEDHGTASHAILTEAAFRLAKEAGVGLLCRIRDPETGKDLWYEWRFAPADLRWGDDVDLLVCDTPEADDPILALTEGFWSQYIITHHTGRLPCKARLRVKDLADFPAEQAMSLVRANGTALERVWSDLLPEDGWYAWDMEQGGSFALLETPDLEDALGRADDGPEETPSRDYLLPLGICVCVLLLLILLLLLRRRKAETPNGEIVMTPVEETHWEAMEDRDETQTGNH